MCSKRSNERPLLPLGARPSQVRCCSTALLLLQACNRGSVSCDAMQKTLDVRHGLRAFPCSFYGREARQLKWSNHSRSGAGPWHQYPGSMPWSSPAFSKPLRPSSVIVADHLSLCRASSRRSNCFLICFTIIRTWARRELPPSPPPK
jgi:hypothetical protein